MSEMPFTCPGEECHADMVLFWHPFPYMLTEQQEQNKLLVLKGQQRQNTQPPKRIL